MRFNLLYILIPSAFIAVVFLLRDFQGKSDYTFFGTAETESRLLSVDEDVWISKIFVKVGEYVRVGDTLAILTSQLKERNELNYGLDLIQIDNDEYAQQKIMSSESASLLAQKNADVAEIQSELRNLKTKDSLDHVYRKLVLGDNVDYDNALVLSSINSLQNKVSQIQNLYYSKINELKEKYNTKKAFSQSEKKQKNALFNFDKKKNHYLILIAPIDGYIDQVAVNSELPIQAFREIVRITPLKSTKVVGFINENSNVPFNLADTVDLSSVVRPNFKTKGIIISTSPKLVELPLRLRRFVEVRAWGRELTIFTPYQNDFYIGEKISISLNVVKNL
ncbi:MAG: efflux RND transporter periplasmic adaptor subunit [Saprospiraceae bacterium]